MAVTKERKDLEREYRGPLRELRGPQKELGGPLIEVGGFQRDLKDPREGGSQRAGRTGRAQKVVEGASDAYD